MLWYGVRGRKGLHGKFVNFISSRVSGCVTGRFEDELRSVPCLEDVTPQNIYEINRKFVMFSRRVRCFMRGSVTAYVHSRRCNATKKFPFDIKPSRSLLIIHKTDGNSQFPPPSNWIISGRFGIHSRDFHFCITLFYIRANIQNDLLKSIGQYIVFRFGLMRDVTAINRNYF